MKYKLTNKYITVKNKKLYQIKALKDFNDIKKDSLGGFIEKEDNLSHDGECWISDNARVYDNAEVSDNAQVYNNARVYGNAQISDNARVYDDAQVFGSAWIFNSAKIFGNTQVFGNALIYNDAKVFGDAWPVSPFYVCLSKHQILSCSYTHLKIGCLVHTIEEWYNKGREIGKENGYSDYEIELYFEAIRLAEVHIELAKKGAK